MGNRLAAIRRQQGIAQRGVAARSGVSAATICAIERWGYRPTEDTCQRIATALGVKVADIWPCEEAGRELVTAA